MMDNCIYPYRQLYDKGDDQCRVGHHFSVEGPRSTLQWLTLSQLDCDHNITGYTLMAVTSQNGGFCQPEPAGHSEDSEQSEMSNTS